MSSIAERVPQVFWVQNKPFPPELRNSEQARIFQKDCLNNNYFGMGWKYLEFNKYANEEYDPVIAEVLRCFVKNSRFTQSQNLYGCMNAGDVVLTRLNDEYFAGIIKFKPKLSDRPELTWYSQVKNWIPLGFSLDLPHHLRGKLSSRKYQGTVAIIDGISAYTVIELVGLTNCEKPTITENNFFETLGDEDLEDLAAHYMLKNNEGFVFLPSSCKKNTPGIEFVMYHPLTKESIACQTKVNREINVADYVMEHSYAQYKTVYLFSGKGYYNNNYNDLKNIEIINKKDLFYLFKNNKHFTDIVEKYFDIE